MLLDDIRVLIRWTANEAELLSAQTAQAESNEALQAMARLKANLDTMAALKDSSRICNSVGTTNLNAAQHGNAIR